MAFTSAMADFHAGFCSRPMADADIDAVVAIEEVSQPIPWSAQVFRDCFTSGYRCDVVTRDEQVVGFIVVSWVLDEAHLLNIAVAPAMQRRGVAWALIRDSIRRCRERGLTQMYLEVRESNTGARALYANLGFEEIGLRRNYYRTVGGRENAVLMMRGLA